MLASIYSLGNPCHKDSFWVEINASANTVCSGEKVELNAVVHGGLSGFVHTWSNGDTGAVISIMPTETTFITLTVNSKRCNRTALAVYAIDVVQVSADLKYNSRDLFVGIRTPIFLEGEFDEWSLMVVDTTTNEVLQESNYIKGATEGYILINELGVYNITAIANKGMCIDTAHAQIIPQANDRLFLPNAIAVNSPHELNRTFKTQLSPVYTNYSLQIFAANGQCLFECFTMNCEWNPTEVTNCRTNKYLYLIKFNDLEGNQQIRKGYFVLLN